jgi:hypothetical protein
MANITGRFARHRRARLRNGMLICPLVPRCFIGRLPDDYQEPTSLGQPGWSLERL